MAKVTHHITVKIAGKYHKPTGKKKMQAQYFKSNQDYLKRVDSQITTTNLSVNAEDTMRGFYTHLFARSFQQLMLPS